jgi:hypothetical protein
MVWTLIRFRYAVEIKLRLREISWYAEVGVEIVRVCSVWCCGCQEMSEKLVWGGKRMRRLVLRLSGYAAFGVEVLRR